MARITDSSTETAIGIQVFLLILSVTNLGLSCIFVFFYHLLAVLFLVFAGVVALFALNTGYTTLYILSIVGYATYFGLEGVQLIISAMEGDSYGAGAAVLFVLFALVGTIVTACSFVSEKKEAEAPVHQPLLIPAVPDQNTVISGASSGDETGPTPTLLNSGSGEAEDAGRGKKLEGANASGATI